MKTRLTAGIIILAFLVSCKTIKDNKAVERVTASKSLLQRVKAPVDSLWPCIIDTTTKFTLGRIDSVLYEKIHVFYIDTVDRKKIIDSLVGVEGICWESSRVAYNLGFEAAKKMCNNIKVPVHQPDTIKIVEVNHRALDIANEARLIAEMKTASIQSSSDNFKHDRKTLFWIVIILVATLVGITFFKLKP